MPSCAYIMFSYDTIRVHCPPTTLHAWFFQLISSFCHQFIVKANPSNQLAFKVLYWSLFVTKISCDLFM